MSKSQVSIEYLNYVVILSIIFIFLLTVYSSRSYKLEMLKEYSEAEKIANKIYTEIELAKESGDGYRRSFYLPAKLLTYDYNVTVQSYEILITWKQNNFKIISEVENISGQITPGWNMIENKKGEIYVS